MEFENIPTPSLTLEPELESVPAEIVEAEPAAREQTLSLIHI